MNTSAIKQISINAKLTPEQRAILVGTILGDGHLETTNKGKTFKLRIEHSISQKAYVDWLYEYFKPMVNTPPRIKQQLVQGKYYQKYGFSTLALTSFRFYGQQFYPRGKKVVPAMIHKLITPLGLAVWFMDDGSLKSAQHRARIINTQGFSDADLIVLRKMLEQKFQIMTTLRKQKEGMQLYILSGEIERFIELIKSYVIPTMEYKIRLTPLHKL